MRKTYKISLIIIISALVVGITYLASYLYSSLFFNSPMHKSFFSRSFDKPRIVVYVKKGFLGEEEHAARILKAAENIGWEAYVNKVPKFSKNTLKEKTIVLYSHLIEYLFNPNFSISIDHRIERRSLSPTFTLITGEDNFVDNSGQATENGKHLLTYDGFFDGDEKHISLQKLYKATNTSKPYIFGVPSSYGPLYAPNIQYLAEAKIFYCGGNWDPKRSSEAFQELFKILEKTGDLDVYGPPKPWAFLKQSYKGFIPYDGISFLNAMYHAGVILCFHSESHIRVGIPSARVFEAIAVGAIPISDEHPFIQRVFGDSVLYVNTSLPPQQLAQQILNHYHWVKTHPQEAADKIKRAQEIFRKRFSTEQMLQNIYKDLYLPTVTKSVSSGIQEPKSA